MRSNALSVALACLVSWAAAQPAALAQEILMQSPGFVVMKHMNGTLALALAEVSAIWQRPATAEQAGAVRVTSPALSEAKTLTGDDAAALWLLLHDGEHASRFVFVSHQGGTLAIPRARIRTAFLGDDGRLRLVHDADPGGKVVEGEEAARVWRQLTG
jgi:hypothetical protein